MTPEHAAKHGFTLSDMGDVDFGQFVRSRGLTYRQHLIGTVWTDKDDNTVAVVSYDNTKPDRNIWIKDA